MVDTLLVADKELKQHYPGDKVYLHEESGVPMKNKFNNPIHSDEYARKYNQNLKGMVEKQMRLAITTTTNYWYTAWVNAGKPDLTDLDPVDQTERNKSNLHRELKLYKQGKLVNIKSEKEY